MKHNSKTYEITEEEREFILAVLESLKRENHWHHSTLGSRLIEKLKLLGEDKPE